MTSREAALVEDLEGWFGDRLRVVGVYDAEGYEVPFWDERARASVTDEQVEALYEDLLLRELDWEFLEDLFEAGSLTCSIHRFEGVTAFHAPGPGKRGLYVSAVTGADPPLDAVADRLRTHVDHRWGEEPAEGSGGATERGADTGPEPATDPDTTESSPEEG